MKSMTEHIKAWKTEYKSSIWKGHYSLDPLGTGCKGRLLDAGCGTGKYTIPLKMRGFDVTGVDVSPGALKMAAKVSKSRELDIEFLAADICRLPFPDASFDVIWCCGVLQHLLLSEREQAVSEFRRLLPRRGRLFLEVMGKEDMRYGGSEVEPDTFNRKKGIIYHYFDKNELKGLLGGFSCRIEESKKEKRFNGRVYLRHMIKVEAKKT
ncbi:Ubiquinone/menaquinone biosynthesis C-methyltransferase UbiE [uncultured archaeon]|nr:Ubiquinone/menaquinone biosynthesis C-methyltransferase UbiE [uncultured archaeon]